MTITVQGPNGVVIDFPDGTDQATIAKAMQQAGGGAAPPPVDPNLLETRRARLKQGLDAAKPAPGWSALGGALDMATFGTLDELSAGLRTGAGLWGDYNKALGEEREKLKAVQEAHPVIFGAGQIGGGLATMAIPGLNMVRGATLAGTAARGALAGGVMGAMYGYGSGEGGPLSEDRLKGAAVGGVTGAATGGAIPMIGRGVGNTWRAIVNARPANRAADVLARAAGNDAVGAPQMTQRLTELGPQGMLADVGPNLQQQAETLAATPSQAQQIVRDALLTREQGANARIRGDIDTTLGVAQPPSQIDDAIRQAQRALGPQYEAALQYAKAVDTSPIALNLESAAVNLRGDAQQAAVKLRQMLNVTGTDQLDPNPGTLLQVRQAIDGMMDNPMLDGNVRRILSQTRQEVDAELARSAPGIKAVDAQFAELARQREALQRGQTVLDSGRGSPWPQELATEYGAASQGVQQRLSEGARAEIERIVGTNNNDVVALNRLIKGEGSWNRDRLATLFGQQRADEIIGVLDRERTFAQTANAVMRNSATARRLSAQAELAPDARGLPRVPWTVTDAVPRVANALLAARSAARQQATNSEVARSLTAQGPEAQAAIQSIADAITRRNRQMAVEQGINYLLTPAARGLTAQTTQALPF